MSSMPTKKSDNHDSRKDTMKTSALRILFLATMLTTLLTAMPTVHAATPSLSLSLTPAGPGSQTTATVALAGVSDIESFTLTLDISDTSDGSILSLVTYARDTSFLPSHQFGTSDPKLELNTIIASSAGTRVFFDGFKPFSSARNTAGTVTLQVSPSATVADSTAACPLKNCRHKIILTGEYLSRSTQNIIAFSPVSMTFSVSDQPRLTVKVDGSGAVNSAPTGIACTSGSCSAPFPKDASIQLMETPAQNATFTSWSGGGCSGADPTCTVTMSADQTVTATFSLAQAVRLLTTIPAYYDFLQAAFGAATGNVTIQGRAMTLTENLTIDKGYSYTFKGGFNGDFTSQTGATTLQGKLTVGTGSLVVERLIVR